MLLKKHEACRRWKCRVSEVLQCLRRAVETSLHYLSDLNVSAETSGKQCASTARTARAASGGIRANGPSTRRNSTRRRRTRGRRLCSTAPTARGKQCCCCQGTQPSLSLLRLPKKDLQHREQTYMSFPCQEHCSSVLPDSEAWPNFNQKHVLVAGSGRSTKRGAGSIKTTFKGAIQTSGSTTSG